MKTKERILHSVLFECLALLILILFAKLYLQRDLAFITGLSILLSVIAMLWNYVYNIIFDRYAGSERITRTLTLRIMHGVLFEMGLLASTLPILMLMLDIGFWQALKLDIALAIFFLVYAVIFNWVYDLTRHHFVSAKPVP
ncbi:MAG: PACE efflux transporter [Pseudomonadales bacterium]